jgi:hypothetical protein
MTHVDLTPIADGAPHLVDRETVPHGADAEPRHRRIRAWTRSALRDVVYSGAVFAWSIAAFAILVTGVAVTTSMLFLVVGVFFWIGFAHVLRWTTRVDRKLAGWQRHERVPAVYRRPAARGFMPYLRTLTSDPQTWKEAARTNGPRDGLARGHLLPCCHAPAPWQPGSGRLRAWSG